MNNDSLIRKVTHRMLLQYTTFDKYKNDFVVEEPTEMEFQRMPSVARLERIGKELYKGRVIMDITPIRHEEVTYELSMEEFYRCATVVKIENKENKEKGE